MSHPRLVVGGARTAAEAAQRTLWTDSVRSWKIQFCHAERRAKILVSMVSGPTKRRFASMPVSASGEKLLRSSSITRTSSSQSRSSSANVTSSASTASIASRSFPIRSLADSERHVSPPEPGAQSRDAVRHRVGTVVGTCQSDRRRRQIVSVAPALEHECAVGCQHQLGKDSCEAATGFDQRHERARRDIEPLQRARPQQASFAYEPVVWIAGRTTPPPGTPRPCLPTVVRIHVPMLWLVEAEVQDRVIELEGGPQQPRLGAG